MRRFMMGVVSVMVFLVSAHADAEIVRFDFDSEQPGSHPAGWRSGATGSGSAKWEVVRDEGAPSRPHVLRQSGHGRFLWAVSEGMQRLDGRVEVKFKTLLGREDQAAGVIWRFLDGGNYYVVRANALEDNVVAYKVVSGRRTDIKPRGAGLMAYGIRAVIRKAAWNTLAVDFSGTTFTVWLNGQRLFDADDPTFGQPGLMGLWTKADSVTLFDDFLVASPIRTGDQP